jgi:hypothetical protein
MNDACNLHAIEQFNFKDENIGRNSVYVNVRGV